MSPMCKNKVSWLYKADASYTWESGFAIGEDRVFLDEHRRVWLIIEAGGRITVARGYAWNGCSPKFCFLDTLWGTPDGVVHARTGRPKTYFASMVHDALYQFLRTNPPFNRAQADKCFLRLMAESDFSLRYVYWGAVRVLGWLVWHGKNARRHWRGTGLPVSALSSGPMTGDVQLRDVTPSDFPIFFEDQRDPEANRMAAFPARDRDAFMAHWVKILADEAVDKKAILFDGHVAGNVVSFDRAGLREVGYWIGKQYWGKGIATRALSQFLDHVKARPLYARVAKHNIASIRVLEKCGFAVFGYDKAPADTGGDEVEDVILKLGADEKKEPR